MENSETSVWIDFAYAYKFIEKELRDELLDNLAEVGRLLNHMIENPDNYKRKEKQL